VTIDGKTIVLVGADMADQTYQLDPQQNNGLAIIWNITRIQRDADRGRFGPAIRRPMSVIPPATDATRANIDWQRVRELANDWYRIEQPLLQVELPIPGGVMRHIVDGNHRLFARQARALQHFTTYIVPPEMEGDYRIRGYVGGREVPLPFC
jgi:hypothetical protein